MANFEIKSLEKLLQDFYNLTGIKTCLYDLDGNELCYYPTKLNGFCRILRQDGEMERRCRNCDQLAFANCRKNRTQHVYTCHAGLVECISPILYDNKIIGFIMLGQIKRTDALSFEDIEPTLPQNLKEELKVAYKELPVISEGKLKSAFSILDACASYELLKTLVEVYNDPIDAQIDKYVRDNLTAPLSVSDICSHFHLSRYEIYGICKKYFNCTPAEYVKKCRLSYALQLLVSSGASIKEIAIACGIPDYNYFSKIFKSTYKTSPTEYRKTQKREGCLIKTAPKPLYITV